MNKRLRLIWMVLFWVVVNHAAHAQQEPQYFGLKVNDTLYEKSPRLATGGKSINTIAQYSLKNYTPYVGSQGECSSCVCWASCYAALTASWPLRRASQIKR